MKHTDINYIEEQIMLLVDGELNPEQEQAILEIIDTKEVYQQLYADYLSLKLDPEEEMVYPFKESLKKTVEMVPAAPKRRWPLYAAAAILPLAVLSSVWIFMRQDSTEQSLTKSQLPPVFTSPIPTTTAPKPTVKPAKPQLLAVVEKTGTEVQKPKPQHNNPVRQNTTSENENTIPTRTVALIHAPQANSYNDIAVASSPVNPIAAPYAAIAYEEDLPDFNGRDNTPKGLLGNVINAGNWFFNEEKTTTIELSLGNKIHKSYTITLK